MNDKSLLNRGDKATGHVWSTHGVDMNGDTYCVRYTRAEDKCNCPSLNALMQRSNAVTVACSGKNNTKEREEELGESIGYDRDVREEILTRMAEIANSATPHPATLGESLRSSLKQVLSDKCQSICGDLRGLLRQIAMDEEACSIRDT